MGDVWTWVAIDADTKLICSWLVGRRDAACATQFIDDLAKRLAHRGFDPGPELGMPYGPCYSFALAGGHRIAVYELTRPGADERLGGRFDFEY